MFLGMFTLVTAYACLLVQLILYAWCTEETGIKIAALCVAVVTAFPLLDLVPRLPYSEPAATQNKPRAASSFGPQVEEP